MENLNGTFTAQQANCLVDAIKQAIHQSLLGIRTTFAGEILEDAVDKGEGVYWYKVQPLLNRITTNGKEITAAYTFDVPATTVRCGNTGILLKYKVKDKVLVQISDRDWTHIKESWEQGKPQGNLFHNLIGAVIVGYLTPNGNMPTNYIDFRDDKSLTIKTPETLKIENKDTQITSTDKVNIEGANKVTLKSTETHLDSAVVKLGTTPTAGVLLAEMILTIANATVTFNGVEGAMTGVISFGNGSSSVKASI